MMEHGQDISSERIELLRNLLEQPDLEYCHEQYPASVSLELVRRTRAVVKVRNHVLSFHLSAEDHGLCRLTAEGPVRFVSTLPKQHAALWRLCFHVAAEAMLAVRNGHKEHVRTAKVKRKIVQSKTMADTP